MIRAAVSVTIVSLLTACGSSTPDGTDSPLLLREARAVDDAFVDQLLDISQTPATAFKAMPVTGRAQYDGQMGVYVAGPDGDRDQDLSLIGQADITANFRNATVEGTVGEFLGYRGTRPRRATVFEADGEIVIGGNASSIGEDNRPAVTTRPNDFATDYAGVLDTSDERIRLDGVLTGQFKGTRVNPPNGEHVTKGLIGVDLRPDIRVDGERRAGNVTLVAEN